MLNVISKIFFLHILLFFTKEVLALEDVSLGLSVSPAIVEQVLTPGESNIRKIRVFNKNKEAVPIKIQVRDFVASADKELVVPNEISAREWITVSPGDFILDPETSREVEIIVSTPLDAAPGGHYASIFLNPVLPLSDYGNNKAYVLTRLAVQQLYLVRGEIVDKIEVSGFRSEQDVFFINPVKLEVIVSNNGNIHKVPKYKIEIENVFNKEKKVFFLEDKIILPKNTRKLISEIELGVGKYKARLEGWDKEIEFIVVPFWILIPTLLLTVILIISMMKYHMKTKILLFTFLLAFLIFPKSANAATLTGSQITLSDPRPSATGVGATVFWNGVTTSTIRCVKLVFSTQASGGSTPTGLNTTSSTFSSSSNYVPTPASWSVDNTVNGTIGITNATGETPASASGRTVILGGLVNGSVGNTQYFVQFSTYNNVDCSTSPVDSGTGVILFTDGQAVSLTIDPTLTFSVSSVGTGQTVNSTPTTVTTTSTTIPFGTVTSSLNGVAAHDVQVSTNAGNGYTVFTRYTGTLTSGSGTTIPDHTGTNSAPTPFSAPGTAAFGYTTEDFTLGTGTASRFQTNNWAGFTTSNAEVIYSNVAVSAQTTRIGYQAGISVTTPAGSYTTTVILTVVPSY